MRPTNCQKTYTWATCCVLTALYTCGVVVVNQNVLLDAQRARGGVGCWKRCLAGDMLLSIPKTSQSYRWARHATTIVLWHSVAQRRVNHAPQQRRSQRTLPSIGTAKLRHIACGIQRASTSSQLGLSLGLKTMRHPLGTARIGELGRNPCIAALYVDISSCPSAPSISKLS